MVDTFTTLQCIRFLYRECESTEKAIIEELLAEDPDARFEVDAMREARRCLPDVLFSAHPRSLESVLSYSRS